MGDWIETCVISHLPIPAGTPTRLLLLVQSPDNSEGAHAGHTGGHALWTPWTLPILGLYDGYGRVADIPASWHTDMILQRLREDGGPTHRKWLGLEPNTESLAGTEAMDFLQKILRRGYAVRATINPDELQTMGMCFIREDVYQALTEAPIYTDTQVLTAKDRAEKLLETIRETKPNTLRTGELNDTIASFEGTEFGESLQAVLRNLVEYRQHTEAFGAYGPPGYRGIGAVRLRIAERIMAGLSPWHPDIEAGATEMGVFEHVILHFEALRLLWGPQNGAGSQTTGWASHAVLSRLVHTVAMQEFETETGRYEDPSAG